jgi:hypothetical protein
MHMYIGLCLLFLRWQQLLSSIQINMILICINVYVYAYRFVSDIFETATASPFNSVRTDP